VFFFLKIMFLFLIFNNSKYNGNPYTHKKMLP